MRDGPVQIPDTADGGRFVAGEGAAVAPVRGERKIQTVSGDAAFQESPPGCGIFGGNLRHMDPLPADPFRIDENGAGKDHRPAQCLAECQGRRDPGDLSGGTAVFIAEVIGSEDKAGALLFTEVKLEFEFAAVPEIIRVQKRDVASSGGIDAGVPRIRGAGILRLFNQTDLRSSFLRECSDLPAGARKRIIRALVIDKDQFPVRVGLLRYGPQL